MNNKYIYIWKEPGIAGSGIPFYVGQGTHQLKGKYLRAYSRHTFGVKRNNTHAQNIVNKLAKLETPHEVIILYDNLTQFEADRLEQILISRLGRRCNKTGVLCNLSEGGEVNPMRDPMIKAKHSKVTSSKEYSENMKIAIAKANTEEYRESCRKATLNWMNDPIKKAEWYAKCKTPEISEKIKAIQAEVSGHKVEFNGIVYRSKKELARHLGISSQLLKYRLENNIPLDYVVHKGNKFNQ